MCVCIHPYLFLVIFLILYIHDGPCQGIDLFYELLAITKLPNNELTSIHTHDLPSLLL